MRRWWTIVKRWWGWQAVEIAEDQQDGQWPGFGARYETGNRRSAFSIRALLRKVRS